MINHGQQTDKADDLERQTQQLRQPQTSNADDDTTTKPRQYTAKPPRSTKVSSVWHWRQRRVYNWLDRPRHATEFVYHALLYAVICLCLLLNVLATLSHSSHVAIVILFYVECCMLVHLAVEHVLRLWSAGSLNRFGGMKGRARFALRVVSVIDLIVITSSFLILLVNFTRPSNAEQELLSPTIVRALRFMQIIRLLHIDRRGATWQMITKELITTLYIGFLGLIFCSYFVYLAEGTSESGGVFGSYADALWWGVITMTTIGYGDVIPQSALGRIIGIAFSIFAISFFALPAGILGSGFALRVQTAQRRKHYNKQVPAAARLLQCTWRCHAAESTRLRESDATWGMYLVRRGLPTDVMSSTQNIHNASISHLMDNVSHMLHHTQEMIRSRTASLVDSESGDDAPKHGQRPRLSSFSGAKGWARLSRRLSLQTPDSPTDDRDGAQWPITELSPTHKAAIRALRRMQLLVARAHFKKSREPYDVRDVMEEQSRGHANVMRKIQHVHRQFEEVIGRSPNHGKTDMAHRMDSIEMLGMETRMDSTLEMLRRIVQPGGQHHMVPHLLARPSNLALSLQ